MGSAEKIERSLGGYIAEKDAAVAVPGRMTGAHLGKD
jgi:hypothetical protein